MRITLSLITALIAFSALAQQPVTPADLQASQEELKRAMEMMNSPEYQQQMKQAMEAAKAQGYDMGGVQQQMMDPAVMQKAMQLGLEMNKCIEQKVGAEGMNRMNQWGQEHHAKTKQLCAEGKREQAVAEQIDFGRRMQATSEFHGMQSCANQYKDQLNAPELANMKKQMDTVTQSIQDDPTHICDRM